jgi:flagellar basal-body rod modification protein FlgD
MTTPTSTLTNSASNPNAGTTVNPKAGQKTLGADDFMKLLTTQLTAQDPMNPMKDTEFIAQMANFSSLEQMRGLSKSFDSFASEQKLTSAPSYLGRQVTVLDAVAGQISGVVDAITLKDGIPAVVIGGKSYETKLITGITTPPPAPSPEVATTTTSASITPAPQS